MQIPFRHKDRLPIGAAGLMLAVTALVVAFPFVARGRSGALTPAPAPRVRATATASSAPTSYPSAMTPSSPATAPTAIATAPVASPSAPATRPAAPASTPATTPPRPAAKPRMVAAAAPSPLDAYRGLGSWVDIWDDRAWNDPAGAVNDMARHGVRTLFVETSNSRSADVLKDPAAMATFIRTAHAHKMKVVAWYLPDMTNLTLDTARIRYAIGYRTSDGQRFDSFALDIESDAVGSVSARNSALATLSQRIRSLVGPKYALGAIIPSPVGISRDFSSWSPFPYGMLAKKYDVFLPMAYYTWHGKGNAAAYADATNNVRIIRSQGGCSKVPVHMIGGLAENSSPSEARAFVRAAVENKCIGAGLYGWAGTTSAEWQQLKVIRP